MLAQANQPADLVIGSLTAATAWFAVLLQGVLTTGSLLNLLSYFTILSNLLVAGSLSLALYWPGSATGRFCARPTTRTAVALYITVVGVVYHTVLRGLFSLSGWSLLADNLLHGAVPVLYMSYWLWFTPRRTLRWPNLIAWLVFPACYLVYSLVRGPLAHWYPYPFLNLSVLGYERVLLNSGCVLLCFVLVGAALVTLNRVLPSRTTEPD